MSKFGDEELITLFQDSFHFVSRKTFWPKLRVATRADRLSQGEFRITEDGGVGFRSLPLPDDQEAHAATFFRKFISGDRSEPYLAEVLGAAERLGVVGEHLDEARDQFAQLIDAKWKFRVEDGKAVGMYLDDGTPVVWGPDKNVRLAECRVVGLSLQDFTQVTFNEGMLHAFVPGRNEEVRAVVRTVSEPLRQALSNVALAGTIYATIILHDVLGKRRLWRCTPDVCPEKKILDAFAAQYAHRCSTQEIPTDSFGLPRD